MKSSIRNEYPFFKNNQKVVYLDSAATALVRGDYLKSLNRLVEGGCTTVHRGSNKLSDQTTIMYENVRLLFADIHSVSPQEIVFTSGTTAACNQIAWSWGMQHLIAGDEILVSIFEHHSSYLPWLRVAQAKGAVIRWVYPDKKTLVWQPEDFIFTAKTKLLVISAYSNVCGPVWSQSDVLKNVIAKAHGAGVCVVVDGAQQAPFEVVNLRDLNPDFYMYSAHKMSGPQGVGVLFVNQTRQADLTPALVGGGTVASVSSEQTFFLRGARAFEAGTPPVLPVIAWGEMQQSLLSSLDFEHERQRLLGFIHCVIESVTKISGVRVLGNTALLKKQGHLVSLVVDDVHAHDIADLLNDEEIIVRAGLHCAQPLHEFLGVTASLRVSVYHYTTQEDVERFCDAFKCAVERLREV